MEAEAGVVGCDVVALSGMSESATGTEPDSDGGSNQESLNITKESCADNSKHISKMEEDDRASADTRLDYDSDKLERGPW